MFIIRLLVVLSSMTFIWQSLMTYEWNTKPFVNQPWPQKPLFKDLGWKLLHCIVPYNTLKSSLVSLFSCLGHCKAWFKHYIFVSYPQGSWPTLPRVMTTTYHTLKLCNQFVGTAKFVHQKILTSSLHDYFRTSCFMMSGHEVLVHNIRMEMNYCLHHQKCLFSFHGKWSNI